MVSANVPLNLGLFKGFFKKRHFDKMTKTHEGTNTGGVNA